jgi:hypothetical protein
MTLKNGTFFEKLKGYIRFSLTPFLNLSLNLLFAVRLQYLLPASLNSRKELFVGDVSALCRADHCVHEDQEVVGTVMLFLVLKEKIHEGLLKPDPRFSFPFFKE